MYIYNKNKLLCFSDQQEKLMIRLENVSLDIYGSKKRILNNINWDIQDGDCWILFGRNGAGKTKLLEMITGYTFPTSGEVIRFDQEQAGTDIRELRKRIGYLSSIVRDMFNRNEKVIDTVISGLYASIGLYSDPTDDQLAKASQLIKMVGLNGREYDMIGHLSDGEKQKILMLRAIINDPDILILDEATAGLDIVAREEFLESLSEIMKNKKHSLIYVTHHVEEITPLFKKIFIIKNGECFFNGNINDAIDKAVFSDLFGRGIEILRNGDRLYTSIK